MGWRCIQGRLVDPAPCHGVEMYSRKAGRPCSLPWGWGCIQGRLVDPAPCHGVEIIQGRLVDPAPCHGVGMYSRKAGRPMLPAMGWGCIQGRPADKSTPPPYPSGKASTSRAADPGPCLRKRLVDQVVKASAARAEDPGFESRLRRDFFGVESCQ